MKKLSNLILTAVFFCAGIFTAAAEANPISFSTIDDPNAVLIQLEDASQSELKVRIFNTNGISVFSETLKNSKTKNRMYNLKNLERGEYTFQLDYDSKIVIQKIVKTYDEVELIESSETVVFKPFIKNSQGVVDVNFLCFEGDFVFKVLDTEGNVLHSEKHKGNGAFTTRYDVSNLEPGTYRCNIFLNSKNYSGNFEKDIEIKDGMAL